MVKVSKALWLIRILMMNQIDLLRLRFRLPPPELAWELQVVSVVLLTLVEVGCGLKSAMVHDNT